MQAAPSTTASRWGGVCWKRQDPDCLAAPPRTACMWWRAWAFFLFGLSFLHLSPRSYCQNLSPSLSFPLSPFSLSQLPVFFYLPWYLLTGSDLNIQEVKSPQQGERLVEIKPSLSWTSLKTLFCVPFWSPLSLTQLGAHMGNSLHSMDQLRHWSIGQTTILVSQKEPG